MKLIHCKNCGDIYNMNYGLKHCSCGKTAGLYIDEENILYGGNKATCLGIDNNAFGTARNNQTLDGFAVRFDSYVCALFCGSTIKVKNFEKMNENEIYHLLARCGLSKKWQEKLHKKRFGITRILYLLSRKLMGIEINKLDKIYIKPTMEKWYYEFTDRVFTLSKRLSVVTGIRTQTKWFRILLTTLLDNPEMIMEWEKIKGNKILYRKIYKYVDEKIDEKDETKTSI